ncbi:MAG: hypothetical protein AAFW69_01090 [Pseudomonadota bacterium]
MTPVPAPERVVVAFPPFDYPWDGPGWGSESFTKRGIAHVSVFHRREDWHQHGEFVPAMEALRADLGPGTAITTYGFSMGGYGALLAAGPLAAERAVAVSPQASIDPGVVPFERRYHDQWAAMEGWYHAPPGAAEGSRMIVLYDPLHRLDRTHEALLGATTGHRRCLMHGAGHAAIQTMVGMGIIETFFDVLRGRADEGALRHAYRGGRRRSFRYLRKVGTVVRKRNSAMAPEFLRLAEEGGFHRLIKKWKTP